MIPIQPIGPGTPRIEQPLKTKRVRRAPKRSRDEDGPEPNTHDDEADGGDENDDNERPRIDLRA